MSATTTRAFAQTPVQKGSLIVRIVFLLVGIMGFIPGVTTDARRP